MPEHKHTPGPWVIHKGDEIDIRSANPADLAQAPIYFVIAENIGGHVHGEQFDDYSEVEANARLIAAAPDLLKACTALIDYDESAEDGDVSMLMAYAKATRLARTAIAKATGQA